jgi:hypothetical protein
VTNKRVVTREDVVTKERGCGCQRSGDVDDKGEGCGDKGERMW